MTKLLSLLLTFVTASSTFAFNLDSLFVRSVGGSDAVETITSATSFTICGKANFNGQEGTFVQYQTPPDKYYMRADFSNFTMTQAYDGETAWQTDMNGRASRLDGMQKNELLKGIYFESFAFLFPERFERRAWYLGDTTSNGQTLHKIAFVFPTDDTVTLVFDRVTGLRRSAVSRMDQLEVEMFYDDYRDVAGIKIPFLSASTIRGVQYRVEMKTDSVILNEPIDPAIYALPDDRVHDFHFPPETDSVLIPFEYTAGHIRLPVTVNGVKKMWVILDSGASANILDKTAVAPLNLKVVGQMPAMGVAGLEQADLIQTDSIQIGELTLYNQVAAAMDMQTMAAILRADSTFGGLVGYDFLSRFPILIDYKRNLLTVYRPDGFVPPAGGVEVPFTLTLLIPTVYGEANGIGGKFLVDLGNSFGLILHHPFVVANELESHLSDVQDNSRLFAGIGGAVAGKNAYLATFRVGEVVLSSLRVLMPDSSQGITGSDQLAGNIGNLILENFKLLLDYDNDRLIFYDTNRNED